MKKEIIEVPVLSSSVRTFGLPLSLVTKANGMVFVWAWRRSTSRPAKSCAAISRRRRKRR